MEATVRNAQRLLTSRSGARIFGSEPDEGFGCCMDDRIYTPSLRASPGAAPRHHRCPPSCLWSPLPSPSLRPSCPSAVSLTPRSEPECSKVKDYCLHRPEVLDDGRSVRHRRVWPVSSIPFPSPTPSCPLHSHYEPQLQPRPSGLLHPPSAARDVALHSCPSESCDDHS